MFTDMVDYTAMTQSDERLALELLEKQREISRPLFRAHGGREIKTIGDAFLVEFESALDATDCAVELQTAMRGYNESAKEGRKIALRVGIHLGDVAHQQGDVLGDAVNIASRIEPLADPGGICISEQVFDQVRNKTSMPLEKVAAAELKGVSFPIDVYRVVLPWQTPPAPESRTGQAKRLAVLPFANMSPDSRDEYFSDGMTEETISTLSKVTGLRIISRTSVMKYKRTDKSLGEISKELGVGAILEGSVRKSGENVRIAVQLIDAKADEHLWSEEYDRKLENVFAIQREIADKVADALRAKLVPMESARMKQDEASDPAAYISFLQGTHLLRENTEDSLRQALELFGRASKADPSFARAYTAAAEALVALGNRGDEPFADSVARAEELTGRAIALNPDLPEAHSMLALIRFMVDDTGPAESEARRAISLNPSLPDPYLNLANIQAVQGRIREALQSAETAYLLDPLTPRAVGLYGHLLFYAGDEQRALEHWKRTAKFAPYLTNLYLCEFHLCRKDFSKAEEAVMALERQSPEDSRTVYSRGMLDAFTGSRKKAMEAIRRLDEASKEGSSNVLLKGFVYWALGDKDLFFDCMFKATEIHALPGIILRYSPLYSAARKDRRYRDLFAKIGVGV